MNHNLLDDGYHMARRVAVTVIGGTIVALGLALLVLPGPASLALPAGLAILGMEFAWAQRFLPALREAAQWVED